MNNVIDLQAVRERKEASRIYNNKIHYVHISSVPIKTEEDLLNDVKSFYADYLARYNKYELIE